MMQWECWRCWWLCSGIGIRFVGFRLELLLLLLLLREEAIRSKSILSSRSFGECCMSRTCGSLGVVNVVVGGGGTSMVVIHDLWILSVDSSVVL
jgi:hypothetical protein